MATGVISSTSSVHVVARHHHLHPRRQLRDSRHVGGPEIKLRTISLEERRVAPAFVFAQHVDFALELLVRLDRSGLRDDLPALHVVLFNAAQQQPDVIARFARVEQLLEHLNAGDDRLAGVAEADDFHFLADLTNAQSRYGPSPLCRAPGSRKYLRSASGTVSLFREPAAGCRCRPLPSARRPSFPTCLLCSVHPTH